MSASLLEKVAQHLTDAGLLTGLAVKYYRWTDADERGSANFIVFRMSGTAGARDATLQQPDVRILLCATAKEVKAGNDKADAIFSNFAGTTTIAGVVKFEPLATVIGPMYLDNGRAVFEINVRCFVQDH